MCNTTSSFSLKMCSNNSGGIKVYVIEQRGSDWLGVRFGRGRGHIRIDVIGNLTARTAPRIGYHISEWARKHPKHSVLIDCSEAYAPPTKVDAALTAIAMVAATTTTTAIVAGALDDAVARMPDAKRNNYAWFGADHRARRWLPAKVV